MACRDLPLPCDSRGGLGWGCLCFSVQPNVAMASDNKQQCGNVGLLPLAALAPHPNPPLLRRGGSTSLHASRYTLKLVSLDTKPVLSASHGILKLDSSLLKAEHVPALSPRTGLRRNDELSGIWLGLRRTTFTQATDESGTRLRINCCSQRSAVPTMKSRSS